MESAVAQDDFEEWVRAERPALVRLAWSLLKDKAEAEDVVQSTLLRVWELHLSGEIRDLHAYAGRAVWVNALRRRARWKDWVPYDSEAFLELGIPEPPADDGGGLELEPWELEQALLGLPASQQTVIRLRYYGGLSFSEIGAALSISLNTAASRCRYALEALRRTFKTDHSNKEEKNGNAKS